jgi:hypothetical protein
MNRKEGKKERERFKEDRRKRLFSQLLGILERGYQIINLLISTICH